MIGILVERGKFLKLPKVERVIDTKSEARYLTVDLLWLRLRFSQVQLVQKSLEKEIRTYCGTWANLARTTNLEPLAGKMAEDILKIVYRARVSKSQGPLQSS